MQLLERTRRDKVRGVAGREPNPSAGPGATSPAIRYRNLSKYRLLARLGGGGMAEVYLAVAGGRGGFNKLQVLKVLRPDLPEADRADFIQMFQDEARLAARLNHPNIVQSHEVGSVDGHEFIAMEYLDGQPLSRVEQRGWPSESDLPLEMQLLVLCQALEGLEYAHSLADYDGTPLDIVHRDVSPQNVFITYTGQIKVVDFGIAKTLESCQTRAGVVKGKVPYMAPEQVLGRRVDLRADIFGAGVMLWEAIARRRIQGPESMYETLRRIVQNDLPRIRDVVPDVPRELERITACAMAHDPAKRYPTAAAFGQELAAFLDDYRKVTAKEVGARVAQLFADERRAINDVIRQAMKDAASAEATGDEPVHLLPSLHTLASATSSILPKDVQALEDKAEPVTAPATRPVRYTSTSPPVNITPIDEPVASRKRWQLGAIAALGLATAAVVAFLVLRKGPGDAPPEINVMAAQPPQPSPSVHLDIRAIPSAAALFLDERALGNAPYDAEQPRDSREHRLEVRAPGFNPRTMAIRLDRDLDLEVRLSETPTAADEKSPATTPAPASSPSAKPRPAIRAPAKSRADDLYQGFPSPKRSKNSSPALDTSDPWGSE